MATRDSRLKFWRKLAQTAPATPTTSTTVPSPTPTTAPTATPVSITQIPNFKAALFQVRPQVINDLNAIANIINKYMVALSNGKITLDMTWKDPSVDQSEFTNSLKHLYGLSKWLYNIVSFNGKPYSLEGLRKIMTDLSATINNYDFPEASVSPIKEQITTITQAILNKLGK